MSNRLNWLICNDESIGRKCRESVQQSAWSSVRTAKRNLQKKSNVRSVGIWRGSLGFGKDHHLLDTIPDVPIAGNFINEIEVFSSLYQTARRSDRNIQLVFGRRRSFWWSFQNVCDMYSDADRCGGFNDPKRQPSFSCCHRGGILLRCNQSLSNVYMTARLNKGNGNESNTRVDQVPSTSSS